MMAGHQGKTLLVNLATAIAIVIAGTLCLTNFGIVGLAAAMFVITVCQNLFNCWLCSHYLNVATFFQVRYSHHAIKFLSNKIPFLRKAEKANAL